jgi:hypothetical protein
LIEKVLTNEVRFVRAYLKQVPLVAGSATVASCNEMVVGGDVAVRKARLRKVLS